MNRVGAEFKPYLTTLPLFDASIVFHHQRLIKICLNVTYTETEFTFDSFFKNKFVKVIKLQTTACSQAINQYRSR